jgi:hypothetical protein
MNPACLNKNRACVKKKMQSYPVYNETISCNIASRGLHNIRSVEILKGLGDNIRRVTTNSSCIAYFKGCAPIEIMGKCYNGKTGS